MRHLSLILLFLALSTSAFSQFYHKEVGLRGGYSSGITFRVNIEETTSYEAQAVYRQDGGIFTILRQKHLDMGMTRGGNWEFIYGMGAHTGFYYTDTYRIFYQEIYYGTKIFTPVIGMDGYAGIDFIMAHAPVSFGISFQPYMEISLRQLFSINLWDFGFHVRYRF